MTAPPDVVPRTTITVTAPRTARHTPRWWRDGVGAATWATLLFVVAMWVGDSGLQNLGTEPLTSLGRLAGLIGADLLLIQVFLMARVPAIERSYGQDELARRHRLVGFTSFWFMITHIVLIVLGYAATLEKGIVGTTVDLVLNYPGMLLATAGTALLVLVVVTSIRRARSKLRYESWHLIHLYGYLGIALSLPHEVWTGADLLTHPVATIFWWAAYGVDGGAVLVYRVWSPVARSMRHQVVVTDVVHEAPGVVSVHMRGRNLARLNADAGQFFNWRFLDGPGWTRANPYSLSAPPTDDTMRITVKNLGDGSARLASLRPGTRVMFEGPYGRLTGDVRTRPKVTLLASGIGVTPLRALLEELPFAPGGATLVYRARDMEDVAFRDELDEIAARRGARVVYALGPRLQGRGHSWLPQDAGHLSEAGALQLLVPDIAEHDVYICGADGWMDAAREAALAAGVPADHVHLERFSW